jgi:serine protease inhibitor
LVYTAFDTSHCTETHEVNINAYLAAVIGAHITAVGVKPVVPVVFSVDHPFLVFIVDSFNKLPLFASRVTDPTAP